MSDDRTERHHDHPGHTAGDVDQHGHRDAAANEVPGEHHQHPDHTPGDLDPHGHRDTTAAPKP